MNNSILKEEINIGKWNTFSSDMKVQPKGNTTYEVKTTHGEIRIATYCKTGFMIQWCAEDCTHPLANCNLSASVLYYRPMVDKNNITEDADYEIIIPKQLPNINMPEPASPID